MRYLVFSLSIFVFGACIQDDNLIESKSNNNTFAFEFIANTSVLESANENTCIADLIESAKVSADKEMSISKENIQEFYDEIDKGSKGVIVVGNHTVVLIDAVSDCKQSGSWGVCMPMGKGYIKRGELEKHEDYINNIIGTPDSQVRLGFIFK